MSIESIVSEKERFKKQITQKKLQIKLAGTLNDELINEIENTEKDNLEKVEKIKQKKHELIEVSKPKKQLDTTELDNERLNYASMSRKRQEDLEERAKRYKITESMITTAFNSRMQELDKLYKLIIKPIQRCKSVPLIQFEVEEEEEIVEEGELEEVETNENENDDYLMNPDIAEEIICQATGEFIQEGDDEIIKQLHESIKSTSKSENIKRIPPKEDVMLYARPMVNAIPLNLAKGEAFVKQKQYYDGIAVIPIDSPWYTCYMASNKNQSHFYTSNPPSLLSLSLVSNDNVPPGKEGGLMAIYRSKAVEKKAIIPIGMLGKTEKQLNGKGEMKNILPIVTQYMNITLKQQMKQLKVKNPENDLKNYESSQGGIDYKFGLLYCAKGQTTEQEMYDNPESVTSKEYNDFMELIGTIIPLKGHKGYRAGLDVRSDTTGVKSLFTVFYSAQVMFHVGTMLPHIEAEEQKTEKKRHIGNDFCVVIYKEGDEIVDLSSFKSHFNSYVDGHVVVTQVGAA